ncbi:class I SAM-dependent methyltransferase [Erysipelotrichaceae bacterium OttesenSCG-928-M19]|nr:class I SAM-dependent methyltransferase [Erysipelotrichaceae bacterium OttesenSCG-928-M19]
MNSLLGILEYSKILIKRYQDSDGIAIDMTLGKGNDTIYLANYFKKVYAFDIQAEALAISQSKILTNEDKIELICDNHDNFLNYVKEEVSLFIYNLGYLPGFSQDITTMVKTTLSSLDKALTVLKKHGIIILVVYPGHQEGYRESQAISEYCDTLNRDYYKISKYEIFSSTKAPYVLAIHKK